MGKRRKKVKRECRTCRFFDLTVYEDGDRWSWCVRYPPAYVGPVVDDDYDEVRDYVTSTECWAHPVVGICDSCGEWRER